MLRLDSLNKKIAELGDVQLHRHVYPGGADFYFFGDDVICEMGVKGGTWSVYTYAINHLTEEQWLAHAKEAIDTKRLDA